jgi:hypothetical protein
LVTLAGTGPLHLYFNIVRLYLSSKYGILLVQINRMRHIFFYGHFYGPVEGEKGWFILKIPDESEGNVTFTFFPGLCNP